MLTKTWIHRGCSQQRKEYREVTCTGMQTDGSKVLSKQTSVWKQQIETQCNMGYSDQDQKGGQLFTVAQWSEAWRKAKWCLRNNDVWASLVAQWWGIHLPGRETQVWSLAGRIPRARSSLQLLRLCSRAWEPQLLKPERPSAHAPQEKLLQWEIPHDNEEQPLFATARERLCNSEDSAQTKISK